MNIVTVQKVSLFCAICQCLHNLLPLLLDLQNGKCSTEILATFVLHNLEVGRRVFINTEVLRRTLHKYISLVETLSLLGLQILKVEY